VNFAFLSQLTRILIAKGARPYLTVWAGAGDDGEGLARSGQPTVRIVLSWRLES
jgi:hypothetical protein